MSNEEMREASGEFNSNNRLTCFIYLLMRDEVRCGGIERIVSEIETKDSFQFTNGWLGRYADHLAGRLQGNAEEGSDGK